MNIRTNKSRKPINGSSTVAATSKKPGAPEKIKKNPLQEAMEDARSRDRKVFWWDEKRNLASDTPFRGSRSVATTPLSTTKAPAKVPPAPKKSALLNRASTLLDPDDTVKDPVKKVKDLIQIAREKGYIPAQK